MPEKRPSRWWYLIPVFFGILGGIAAYLLLEDRDRKFAKRLIVVGIIMTVVWFGLYLVANALKMILLASIVGLRYLL